MLPVEPAPPRRWRKRLVIGCVVLIGLFLLTGSILWAMIVSAAGAPERPRHQVFAHSLPPGPGTIELDTRMTTVDIVPGPPGSALSLEASWDAERYHLEEALTPSGDSWRYSVRFHGRPLRYFAFNWDDNLEVGGGRLKITVPRDREAELEGKIGLGDSHLELGGLSLTTLDLHLGAGDHEKAFGEPTTQPLSLLRVDGTMGEITIDHAGNASPHRLSVEHGMGDLVLDLTGQWRNDGDVRLHLGMGDSEVHLPRAEEAGAIVERAHVGLGDGQIHDRPLAELPPGVPRVRIRATSGMGDLRIQ